MAIQDSKTMIGTLLLSLFVVIENVQASLPANVGTQTFIPNDPAPTFTIPLSNDSSPLTYNANLGLRPDTSTASDFFPLLVMSVNSMDLFTNYLISSMDSINAFLKDGPTGCHFLFSADTAAQVKSIEAAIMGALKLTSLELQNEWTGYLHFTNDSAQIALGPQVQTIMQQWRSPRNVITFGEMNVSRLDCRYTWCAWPGETDQFQLSVAVGDVCGTIAKPPSNTFLLLQLTSKSNCSAEDAAMKAVNAGAAGVVVAQASSTLVAPLGHAGNGALNTVGTTVSAEDGAKLSNAISASATKSINASFATFANIGQLMAIDSWGFIQEVGWGKYSTLEMLSWEAQWLAYRKQLSQELRAPAYIIPVFDQAVLTSNTSITMPPRTLLQQFDSMHLDFALTCAGNMDRDCSVWDRIVDVFVNCGNGTFELGRYINAFQRRVGRWLTSVPMLPLLYPSNGDGVCYFTTTVGMGDHWLGTLNLRFGNPRPNDVVDSFGQPSSGFEIKYPNTNVQFTGPTYNTNRTIEFDVPKGTTRVAVAAFITGHGGCEFLPTSHHWEINQDNSSRYNTSNPMYFDRYMQAGTGLGCAQKTIRGAVPNEHGTWYFGRNGWCDGQDVKPIIFDITDTVKLDNSIKNSLRYYGLSYPVGQPNSPSQSGCGGDMEMSTYLLFYSTE